jgi:hypothetical protein
MDRRLSLPLPAGPSCNGSRLIQTASSGAPTSRFAQPWGHSQGGAAVTKLTPEDFAPRS